jgi:hypothetical protein
MRSIIGASVSIVLGVAVTYLSGYFYNPFAGRTVDLITIDHQQSSIIIIQKSYYHKRNQIR